MSPASARVGGMFVGGYPSVFVCIYVWEDPVGAAGASRLTLAASLVRAGRSAAATAQHVATKIGGRICGARG